MSDLEKVNDALRYCYYEVPEEARETLELEGRDLKDLWELHKTAEGYAKCARLLLDVVRARLKDEVGVGKSVRLDDNFVRVAPERSLIWDDPEGLVEWIGEDWHEVVNVDNSVRITSLRAVAERRGLPTDFAEETFGHREDKGDPKLQILPFERMPKFARELPHGERV